MPEMIHTSALTANNDFQPRTGLNRMHVDAMVKALQDDPMAFESQPIKVWRIGGALTIVDGLHRYASFQKMKIAIVPVEVHETSRIEGISDDEHLQQERREAMRYAIVSNLHNGSLLKRNRADNQRAIRMLLTDPVTRRYTDSAIAKLVGVEGSTVAAVRKKHPEFQTEERIGTDGRSVHRQILSSNTGNKLREKTAAVEAASVALSEKKPTIMVRDVDDAHDLSQARHVDDAIVDDDEAEEAILFHAQFESTVEASSPAALEEKPIALVCKAVEPDREPPLPKRVDAITLSTLNTAEPQLHEQFQEVRQLWMPFRDEFLERYGVDIAICTLFAFGKAIFDHTQALMKEADRQKQRLELANPTDEIVSTRVKPAAKTKAKPTTKPNPAAKTAAAHDVFDRVKTPNVHLSDDKPIKRRKRREKANFLGWSFG